MTLKKKILITFLVIFTCQTVIIDTTNQNNINKNNQPIKQIIQSIPKIIKESQISQELYGLRGTTKQYLPSYPYLQDSIASSPLTKPGYLNQPTQVSSVKPASPLQPQITTTIASVTTVKPIPSQLVVNQPIQTSLGSGQIKISESQYQSKIPNFSTKPITLEASVLQHQSSLPLIPSTGSSSFLQSFPGTLVNQPALQLGQSSIPQQTIQQTSLISQIPIQTSKSLISAQAIQSNQQNLPNQYEQTKYQQAQLKTQTAHSLINQPIKQEPIKQSIQSINTTSIQNLMYPKTQTSQIYPQLNVPAQQSFNSQSVISQPINTLIHPTYVQTQEKTNIKQAIANNSQQLQAQVHLKPVQQTVIQSVQQIQPLQQVQLVQPNKNQLNQPITIATMPTSTLTPTQTSVINNPIRSTSQFSKLIIPQSVSSILPNGKQQSQSLSTLLSTMGQYRQSIQNTYTPVIQTTTTKPSTETTTHSTQFNKSSQSAQAVIQPSVETSNHILGNNNTIIGTSNIGQGDMNSLIGINNKFSGNGNKLTGLNNVIVGDINSISKGQNNTILGNANVLADKSSNNILLLSNYNGVNGSGNVIYRASMNMINGSNNIISDFNVSQGGSKIETSIQEKQGMLNPQLRNSYNKVNGDGNIVAGIDNSINGNGNAIKGIMNGINGDSNLVYGLGNKVQGTQNVVYGEGNVVKGLDNGSMTSILDQYKVIGQNQIKQRPNLRTSHSHSEGNTDSPKKLKEGSLNATKVKTSAQFSTLQKGQTKNSISEQQLPSQLSISPFVPQDKLDTQVYPNEIKSANEIKTEIIAH